MDGITRLFVVLFVIGWYFSVRSIIFYYFLAGRGRSDDFDWWWSWLAALPFSFLSLILTAALVGAVVWIVAGFK